jgi:hypothetical protein
MAVAVPTCLCILYCWFVCGGQELSFVPASAPSRLSYMQGQWNRNWIVVAFLFPLPPHPPPSFVWCDTWVKIHHLWERPQASDSIPCRINILQVNDYHVLGPDPPLVGKTSGFWLNTVQVKYSAGKWLACPESRSTTCGKDLRFLTRYHAG